jgi:FkbH-like protein
MQDSIPHHLSIGDFVAPKDLERSEIEYRSILLVGSCLAFEWLQLIKSYGVQCDYVISNNFSHLPDSAPRPLSDYDFQIIQMPLRSVLHENSYSHIGYNDIEAYERLFDLCKSEVTRYFNILLKWNKGSGLTSFVMNFLVPQQNPFGRVLNRYDLRNPVYFIDKLNEHLASLVFSTTNTYLLDIDLVSSKYGKMRLQDDALTSVSHGGLLNDALYELDNRRISPPELPPSATLLGGGKAREEFYQLVWAELNASFRTINQVDAIKLVIFDLDDTLWRGVIAEEDSISADNIEGWPVGVIEAICFLKSRGMILAIVSKNNIDTINDIFDRVVGGRIKLSDFAIKKINWEPKAKNIAIVLSECNLLAKNALFVDDNPVERAAVQSAFPDIRVLGLDLYKIRRVLLGASEMQVATISSESSGRAESVQKILDREQLRTTLSHDDFLRSLETKITFATIEDINDTKFSRAFELLNKTNQFNTTGKKWTIERLVAFFEKSGYMECFNLRDMHSDYGLVGAALVYQNWIEQMVMSCRVFGMGAETAFLAHLGRKFERAGYDAIKASYVVTEANAVSLSFYRESGFEESDDFLWLSSSRFPASPTHIRVIG